MRRLETKGSGWCHRKSEG